ncbi:MAG TPA: hypothetical protein VM659_22565 [Dongiaceae bacterium]|nr:hypothetical protein [Dongiaceae bacterium]
MNLSTSFMDQAVAWAWYILWPIVGIIALLVLNRIAGVVRYIPNNRIAIVEKLWSFGGSIESGLIALHGEAGFQPDVRRGGFQFFLPFQYRLHEANLVTIPQGEIGYVFARDGQTLAATQSLGSNVTAHDVQDARAFLQNGGQKGPQRKILREGTYAINLAQFVVLTREAVHSLQLDPAEVALFEHMSDVIAERNGFAPVVIKGSDDSIGVVTVHDGPALPAGQIIAATVGADQSNDATFHNNFQDPEKFLAAGGCRGRQLQVLVDGS